MKEHDLALAFSADEICEEQILPFFLVSVSFAYGFDHVLIGFRPHDEGFDDFLVDSRRFQPVDLEQVCKELVPTLFIIYRVSAPHNRSCKA